MDVDFIVHNGFRQSIVVGYLDTHKKKIESMNMLFLSEIKQASEVQARSIFMNKAIYLFVIIIQLAFSLNVQYIVYGVAFVVVEE